VPFESEQNELFQEDLFHYYLAIIFHTYMFLKDFMDMADRCGITCGHSIGTHIGIGGKVPHSFIKYNNS